MGLRDFLRKQRSRYPSQEAMVAFIEERTGCPISQSALSYWLTGDRYPEARSRLALRTAFDVSLRNWRRMMAFDRVAEEDEETLPVSGVRAV